MKVKYYYIGKAKDFVIHEIPEKKDRHRLPSVKVS